MAEPTASDDRKTDLATAHRLLADLKSILNEHDTITQHVRCCQIDAEFANGWLQSEQCVLLLAVRVSMDVPAWRVAVFEDAIEAAATITSRQIRGSHTVPVERIEAEATRPGTPTPPPEAQRAHTGYYTIKRDVTDQLPSIDASTGSR